MITGINELKTLTKHRSCWLKCKSDGQKCNPNQRWNNDKCWCECRKHHICEKDYVWNYATCNCKYGKYLASVINDSGLKSNDEKTKTFPTNFNENNIPYKSQNVSILFILLLITIALLIANSTYYYLIKCQAKRKHLLQYYGTNNGLKQVLYW